VGTLIRFAILTVAGLVTLVPFEADAWIRGLKSQEYEIPRQSNVVIDGDTSDWDAAGFSVGPLAGKDGSVLPADDFDVHLRLGWSPEGLLFSVKIRDDVSNEGTVDRLTGFDSLSLRVADAVIPDRFFVANIAAGADTRFDGPRITVDRRSPISVDIEAATNMIGDTISLELRVPLEPFGEGALGRKFEVQVVVRDRDGQGDPVSVAWFPWVDLSVGGMAHRIRLSDHASPDVRGSAAGAYPDYLNGRVTVVCDADLVGRRANLVDGDHQIAAGVLEEMSGRASAVLEFRMPQRGKPYRDPRVVVDGSAPIPVALLDADDHRAWSFTWHRVLFDGYTFSGDAFPTPRLEKPLFAEHQIGPYTIQTDYFDRNYNKVDAPTDEGRYGAVISIHSEESGYTYKRYRTLYKYSGYIRWWERDLEGGIEFPEEFGIDPVVLEDKRKVVAEHLKWQFTSGLSRDQRAGALLAGLRESVPGSGEESVYNDVWARDRAWWVGLKRKLLGDAPVEPLECPTGVFKGRARELVFSTDEEAGFTPGATQAIKDVCRGWWQSSGEPFSICVAKAGKIIHLQSYGDRDGKPVTLTTKTPIASVTKLLTGTLMAMLVEHRRVDLDAPVATYLPAFRGTPVEKTLTIRHLMNHTSGMRSHWGDEDNDFEELAAGYAPQMLIGKTYQYNGTAFALAGKVIEAVSGESLPAFIKRHLLDPLDCRDTDVFGTSWDGLSTPLDLARIGQLLLNKGAYGDFRFFEYAAYEAMLPKPLAPVIPGTWRKYGLGTVYYTDEGLGVGTFGHGAASSTIFRVDPKNDMVIVVTRWRKGDGYRDHKEKLFQTIVSHIPTTNEL
jgi:CubicO group peptidase (beta-lactamase class C family)